MNDVIEVIFLVVTLLDVGIVREITYHQTESALHSSNSMRVLQNNIQSINTSKAFLNAAISRNNVDVVVLQEVWHPSDDLIFHGFRKPTMKLRDDRGLSFQIFCRQPAEKRIFQASGLIQPPPQYE